LRPHSAELRLHIHDALDGVEQVKGAAREAVDPRHRSPLGVGAMFADQRLADFTRPLYRIAGS
jgi:hypothetical protein